MKAEKLLCKIQAGFTLVELMVVVALIAIMLMIASPSFTEIQRNSELTSATNNLVATLNNARSEAMKNGAYAGITPTTTGTDWNSGITLFIDKNFTQSLDSTPVPADTELKKSDVLPSYLTITSSNATKPSLLFNASGYLAQGFTNTTFTIQRTDVPAAQQIAQTRRVVIAITGRVRSCKPVSATDADCKVSNN